MEYIKEIIIGVLIIVILVLITWKTKGGKKKVPVNDKEIRKTTNEIRKELRKEHKQLTQLFKDLDGFVEQLPEFIALKKTNMEDNYEAETKPIKKLSDYYKKD